MNLPGMAMAFLLPAGILMVSWGGLEHSRRAANAGLLALALSCLAYTAAGFAFQFGGIWHTIPKETYRALDQTWSLPDSTGNAWNIIGLTGFMLIGVTQSDSIALFLHQLPLVMTATMLPMLALVGRARNLVVAATGLIAALVIFPLTGNWVWSGGWLAALGENLRLGHGYVDWGGAGAVYAVSGLLTLVGLGLFARPRQHPAETAQLPQAHLPLLTIAGGILFGLGWMAWTASNPLHPTSAVLNIPLAMVNGLLAASASMLIAQLYSWFVISRVDAQMAIHGWLAGWVIASASAPFIEPWSALILGALAGLLMPMMMYAADHILRLEDTLAIVSVYGVPGLLGALAVGILANGRWGAGWNGIGAQEYLLVAGQGVTGLVTAAGFTADSGQLTAQLVGMGAIAAFALIAGGVTMTIAHLIARAWGHTSNSE